MKLLHILLFESQRILKTEAASLRLLGNQPHFVWIQLLFNPPLFLPDKKDRFWIKQHLGAKLGFWCDAGKSGRWVGGVSSTRFGSFLKTL